MSPGESQISASRITGSFRDPSGYVFMHEGRVFRAIDETCWTTLQETSQKGLLDKWGKEGALVGTRFVTEAALREGLARAHPGFTRFLEHDRIETITYPYEWSFSMLGAAAVRTLDLQIELARAGLALKDASAYNIQFVQGRPVFIDVSSIERPARADLWFALGQFNRMFLFPLLLHRHRGWDFRSYFIANLDGRNLEQVGASFGRLERWKPSLLLDLTLPLLLERKNQTRASASPAPSARKQNGADAQLINLRRLRSKILKLVSAHRPRGVWAEYTSTCTYDAAAENSKKESVRSFLAATKPARLLDIGCNTGDYSLLAAESGASVMAADADPDAVELLFRRLQGSPANITPLVVDLANPSPAIGFMNQERSSFLDRAQPDCVLALALIHHLLVSANFSLAAIRDVFHRLTRRDLILEFVPRDDPMFEKLMKFRVDLFGAYNLEAVLREFEPRFELLERRAIQHSPRTLLFLRKRS